MMLKLADVITKANTGLDAIKRAPIVDKNTGIKCIRIQDVSQEKKYKDWGNTEVLSSDFVKFQLKKDDILIARTGATIGVNMIINQDISAVYNNGLIRIKINKKIANPLYIYYILNTRQYWGRIRAISSGTVAQPNMKMNDLLNFEFFLPSLKVQEQIVNKLKFYDDKIEINQLMMEKLLQLSIITYKKIFKDKDVNGNIDSILKEEDKSKIKVGEARNREGIYPFFTSGKNILDFEEYLVDNKHIFLNTGGSADVKYFDGRCAYSTDTWCIRGTKNYTNYLFLLLVSMKEEIEKSYFQGSALKHLQKKNLKNKKIYIPSDEELEKFNNLVDNYLSLYSNLFTENKKLFNLRYLQIIKELEL